MTLPLQPIDQALLEADFRLDTTEKYLGLHAYTYRHPDTGAICLIKVQEPSDVAHLRVKNIDMEHGTYLTLDMTECCKTSTIENLKAIGFSQLTLADSVNIEYLTLRDSTLSHPTLIQSHPLYFLKMTDSESYYCTIEVPAETQYHSVSLDEAKINSCHLEPSAQVISESFIRGIHLTQRLHLTSPEIHHAHIDLRPAVNASDDAIYTLPKPPMHGKVLNLNNHAIDYTLLVDKDGTRYLQLGCWLGTLHEAQVLIDGDYAQWPSHHSLNDYTVPAIAAARARYRGLIQMLIHTPVS